eukprot:591970-Prorocentrum_minimum.AAC.1
MLSSLLVLSMLISLLVLSVLSSLLVLSVLSSLLVLSMLSSLLVLSVLRAAGQAARGGAGPARGAGGVPRATWGDASRHHRAPQQLGAGVEAGATRTPHPRSWAALRTDGSRRAHPARVAPRFFIQRPRRANPGWVASRLIRRSWEVSPP